MNCVVQSVLCVLVVLAMAPPFGLSQFIDNHQDKLNVTLFKAGTQFDSAPFLIEDANHHRTTWSLSMAQPIVPSNKASSVKVLLELKSWNLQRVYANAYFVVKVGTVEYPITGTPFHTSASTATFTPAISWRLSDVAANHFKNVAASLDSVVVQIHLVIYSIQ